MINNIYANGNQTDDIQNLQKWYTDITDIQNLQKWFSIRILCQANLTKYQHKVITNLRCCNLALAIETLGYILPQTPLTERISNICTTSETEDKLYFLVKWEFLWYLIYLFPKSIIIIQICISMITHWKRNFFIWYQPIIIRYTWRLVYKNFTCIPQ